MAANRFYTSIGRLLLVACVVVMGLMASEHHGSVKSGGLPVPGASVTATQGDKKVLTTTDENGSYSFPDLAHRAWTISIAMLGFDKPRAPPASRCCTSSAPATASPDGTPHTPG